MVAKKPRCDILNKKEKSLLCVMPLKPARFLDPKNDVTFKKIFGQNPDLMKSFLNGVLPLPEDGLIETISYLTPEQAPRIPAMKNTIVDVKCRDQKGRLFIVEMQLQWSDSFAKRLQFGVSKAYVQQLQKGEDYKHLCPVYGLGIINAIFDRSTEMWFHHYKTVNVKDSLKVLEGLEYVFIELPKFKPSTVLERKMGVLWLRFLKELGEGVTEVPDEFQGSPELMKAMELAQESAYNPKELEAYDQYWDVVRVESTVRSDALAEGWAQGRAEGRAEGHAEGHAEGERQAQLKIAKALLASGMPKDQVIAMTGLSVKDVEEALTLFSS